MGAVTSGEVMCTPGMPAAAITSASPSVAQQMPSAPAATWRRAIASRFVRLGMRAQRDARRPRMRRHRRDVALERVEIEQQRRRVERVAAARDADERRVGARAIIGHGLRFFTAAGGEINRRVRRS